MSSQNTEILTEEQDLEFIAWHIIGLYTRGFPLPVNQTERTTSHTNHAPISYRKDDVVTFGIKGMSNIERGAVYKLPVYIKNLNANNNGLGLFGFQVELGIDDGIVYEGYEVSPYWASKLNVYTKRDSGGRHILTVNSLKGIDEENDYTDKVLFYIKVKVSETAPNNQWSVRFTGSQTYPIMKRGIDLKIFNPYKVEDGLLSEEYVESEKNIVELGGSEVNLPDPPQPPKMDFELELVVGGIGGMTKEPLTITVKIYSNGMYVGSHTSTGGLGFNKISGEVNLNLTTGGLQDITYTVEVEDEDGNEYYVEIPFGGFSFKINTEISGNMEDYKRFIYKKYVDVIGFEEVLEVLVRIASTVEVENWYVTEQIILTETSPNKDDSDLYTVIIEQLGFSDSKLDIHKMSTVLRNSFLEYIDYRDIDPVIKVEYIGDIVQVVLEYYGMTDISVKEKELITSGVIAELEQLGLIDEETGKTMYVGDIFQVVTERLGFTETDNKVDILLSLLSEAIALEAKGDAGFGEVLVIYENDVKVYDSED